MGQAQQPLRIAAQDRVSRRIAQAVMEADRIRLGHVEGIVAAEAQAINAPFVEQG